MTNNDDYPAHNTTVVFVPAPPSKPRKKGSSALISLSLLTALLAITLFWWIQQSSITAGTSPELGENAVLTASENQDGVLAIVGADGAALYDEPGGFEVASFGAGEELTAIGRTEDNTWVSVSAKNGQAGWTPKESVVLVGLNRLPITGDNALARDDNGSGNDGSGNDDRGATSELAPTSTPFVVETPTRSAGGTGDIGDASNEPGDEETANGESMADEATNGEPVIGESTADQASMSGDVSSEETEATATEMPEPTATPEPTLVPTATLEPTPEPTLPPIPTIAPTPEPTAIPEPTATTGPEAASNDDNNAPEAAAPVPTSALGVGRTSTTLGVVRGADAQLLSSPNGDGLVSLKVGDSLSIIGRTDGTEWLKVNTDEDQDGWLPRTDVVAFRLENVPVVGTDSTMIGSTITDSVAADSQMASDDASGGAAGRTSSGTSSEMPADSGEADQMEGADTSTVVPSSDDTSTSDTSTDEASTADTSAPNDTSATANSTDRPTSGVTASTSSPSGALAGTISNSITQLNVRSGPGVNFPSIGKANANDVLTIVGRSQNGQWLQSNNPVPSVSQGWVSANFVSLNGAASTLPVVPVVGAVTDAGASVNLDTDSSTDSAAASAPANAAPANAAPANAAPANNAPANAAPVDGLSGKLVFQGELGGPIYLYNFSSGSVQQITTGLDPNLSPDGQRVAFTRLGSNGGVYVINVDGSNERQLFGSDQAPRSPSWSPAGDKIVFSRLSGEYRCTNLGFGLCVKNNKFLSGFAQTVKEERGLSRIDLDGENFRDIPALNTANTPDWVNAGIIYGATSSLEITQDSDDGQNTGIINQIIGYQDPAGQPGGGRVIFHAKEGSHWEIFGINPDGSGIAALTKPVTTLVDELPSNVAPAWSPDGGSIVYVSNRDANNSAGPWRIWVMNADGSNKRPLPIDVPMNYQFNLEQMVHWGP